MKLIEAVENNDLELVKKLIKEGYPLDEIELVNCGVTALMFSSMRGRIEIAIELIKAGASLDKTNFDGWTALMYASSFEYVEVIKELIKAGASLNEKSNNDNTALDYNKKIWHQFEIQDLVLSMYPDKYSFLEEKVGIHKDILLKLKMEQILDV